MPSIITNVIKNKKHKRCTTFWFKWESIIMYLAYKHRNQLTAMFICEFFLTARLYKSDFFLLFSTHWFMPMLNGLYKSDSYFFLEVLLANKIKYYLHIKISNEN
jgi:hypothetical protein